MHTMQYAKIEVQNENMELIINRSIRSANTSLTIVEAGHSFPRCGKRVDMITSCLQLHYVVRGKGKFRGKEISEGMGFLVLSGEAQDMCVESDDFRQFWINFDGTEAHGILQSCGISVESHIFDLSGDIEKRELMLSLFESIFPKSKDTSKSSPYYSHTYLTGLLYQLLSVIEKDTQLSKSTCEQYTETVRSYIKSHYAQALNIEWLSALVGLSPKYLIRIFKKSTGCTLVEYITRVRMENAKKLLSETSRSIGEIAENIGYTDALYFSKVFTRFFGQSPSRYRKKSDT